MTQPLEQARRQMRAAAHALADQNSARVGEVRSAQIVYSDVTAVNAGAATDGNATINVTYRNGTTLAAGWNAAQTFVVGQRVLCLLDDQGQLTVICPLVGQP
jgi:molecular chaperone DnaK (HSP70)